MGEVTAKNSERAVTLFTSSLSPPRILHEYHDFPIYFIEFNRKPKIPEKAEIFILVLSLYEFSYGLDRTILYTWEYPPSQRG